MYRIFNISLFYEGFNCHPLYQWLYPCLLCIPRGPLFHSIVPHGSLLDQLEDVLLSQRMFGLQSLKPFLLQIHSISHLEKRFYWFRSHFPVHLFMLSIHIWPQEVEDSGQEYHYWDNTVGGKEFSKIYWLKHACICKILVEKTRCSNINNMVINSINIEWIGTQLIQIQESRIQAVIIFDSY